MDTTSYQQPPSSYDMTERIKKIISDTGLSERAFAASCGITQQTLNKQLKGGRELSLSVVSAILNTYTNISAEWLLRGEGNQNRNQTQESDKERLLIDTITTQQEIINRLKEQIKNLGVSPQVQNSKFQ